MKRPKDITLLKRVIETISDDASNKIATYVDFKLVERFLSYAIESLGCGEGALVALHRIEVRVKSLENEAECIRNQMR